MKDYIVKSKCPSCFKNIGIGWKFCPFCGEYVDNTKPKVDLKYVDSIRIDNDQENKNISFKMPSTLQHMGDRIKETISEKLDKGEEVQDHTISLFTFVLKEGSVVTKEIPEILNDDKNILLEKDHIGYYLQSDLEVIYINNAKIDIGKKHYLNNDSVFLDIYLYFIQSKV